MQYPRLYFRDENKELLEDGFCIEHKIKKLSIVGDVSSIIYIYIYCFYITLSCLYR